MYQLNNRTSNVLGFFICHELLIAGYYFQFVEGLDPCPLCIFQRVCFMALGLVFALGIIFDGGSRYKKVVNILGIVSAAMGMLFAGRHLYLQGLPAEEVPECGPGLDYMMELFSYFDVLKKVMTGSGECAEISWEFLGLTMPAWAMVWFVAFAGLFIWRYLTVPSDEKPL